MSRVFLTLGALAVSALAIAGTSLAQTAQPTGPTTGAAQADGAQPAGTVPEPALRRPSVDQPPPGNPPPFGSRIGGPIHETGRYDGLGQGAATGSGLDSNQRPLVEPDYRRSDQPGVDRSRP